MRNLIESLEVTEKVIEDDEYVWHTYNGPRTILVTKNRKRTAELTKGSQFGLRLARSNPNMERLMVPEHGPSIVFSLTHEEADKLRSKSQK